MIVQPTIHDSLRYRKRGPIAERQYRDDVMRYEAFGFAPTLGFDLGGAGPRGFGGNFSSLFTGVLQSVQTDLGLSYSTTFIATGSAPPVVGLSTSTTTAVPKPIRVTTTAGALGVSNYALSHDNGGSTAQSGLTSASIPITALPGIAITFPAGPYIGDEVYTAACSGLLDQSGGGWHYTQGTLTRQPALTVGLGGFAGLGFDGVNDFLASLLALPLAATTPTSILAVFRILVGSAAAAVFVPTAAADFLSIKNLNALTATNGTPGSAAVTVTAWARMRADFGNLATDVFRWGSVQPANSNKGNNAFSTGRVIGAFGDASFPSNMELLQLLFLNHAPSGTEMTTFDAAVMAKYGGSVGL